MPVLNTQGAAPSAISSSSVLALAPYSIKTAVRELVAVGAGADLTLATITGSGTVLSLWMAISGAGIGLDGVVKIYVDGEAQPSVSFDVGSLGNRGPTVSGRYFTPRVQIEFGSSAVDFVLRFPVFYSTSVQIVFHNAAATGGNVWSIVTYTADSTQPLRLKSAGAPYALGTTLAAPQNYTFLNLSSGAGWLVWHSLVGHSGSALNYLESNINAYVNGETTASVQSSGTEDWFGSGFYFVAGPASGPISYCTLSSSSTGDAAMALDLLSWVGGLKFTSGVQLKWEAGTGDVPRETTTVTIAYLVLYYLAI